jgi:hypothetical protein
MEYMLNMWIARSRDEVSPSAMNKRETRQGWVSAFDAYVNKLSCGKIEPTYTCESVPGK